MNRKEGRGNRIKFLKPLDFVLILAFTLLFIYDFFPTVTFADAIPKGVLILLIIGLFVISLIIKKNKDTNNKDMLKWQVFSTVYILLLVGICTILGGRSSSGIGLDNGVLWIVLLISLFQINSQWKKVKRSEV